MTVPPVGSVVHERDDVLTESEMTEAARLCQAESGEPLAAAFVLALRTVMASGALPGGAIMLGHRSTWLAPLEPGEYHTTMAIREADPPRTRYQRVVIGYVTWRGGELILDQAQEVLWPTAS